MTSKEIEFSPPPKHVQRRSPQNPHASQQHASNAQELRRQKYLDRVRHVSEEYRWAQRSDQILRQQYVDQRRSWELEKALSAPDDHGVWDEDNKEDHHSDSFDSDSGAVADDALRQEREALESLIFWAETSSSEERNQFGNDTADNEDEELDQLLTNLMACDPSDKNASLCEGCSSQDMDISAG